MRKVVYSQPLHAIWAHKHTLQHIAAYIVCITMLSCGTASKTAHYLLFLLLFVVERHHGLLRLCINRLHDSKQAEGNIEAICEVFRHV